MNMYNRNFISNRVSLEAAMGKTDLIEELLKDSRFPKDDLTRFTDIAAVGLARNGYTKGLKHLIEDVGIEVDKVLKTLIRDASRSGNMDTVYYLTQYQKGEKDFSKRENQMNLEKVSYHKPSQEPESEKRGMEIIQNGKSGVFINSGTFTGNIVQNGRPLNIQDFSIHHPSERGVFIQNSMKNAEEKSESMEQKDDKSFSMEEYIRTHGKVSNECIHISTDEQEINIDMKNDNVYIHFGNDR